MVNVQFHSDSREPLPQMAGGRGRFNMLLTQDRPQDAGHWSSQLPRLLEPQGVVSYVVRSGVDAVAVAERFEVHAAVIDMATPRNEADGGAAINSRAAGLWLLELLRRLPNCPPVVIVYDAHVNQRDIGRLLHEALRLGAFSVLNKPIGLDQLLATFQRLVDRQYRGAWPTMNATQANAQTQASNPRPQSPGRSGA